MRGQTPKIWRSLETRFLRYANGQSDRLIAMPARHVQVTGVRGLRRTVYRTESSTDRLARISKTTFRELPMMLTLVAVLGYWLSLKAEVRSLVPALALMGGLPHPGFHRQTRGEILTAPPGVQMRRVCARTPPRVTAHDDAVALSVPLPCLLLILINEILFCSVLFFSHPRSEGWPHHGRAFSIYLCPLSF